MPIDVAIDTHQKVFNFGRRLNEAPDVHIDDDVRAAKETLIEILNQAPIMEYHLGKMFSRWHGETILKTAPCHHHERVLIDTAGNRVEQINKPRI